MASADQLKVSSEVKKVHHWLRKRTQEVGAEKAWDEHLKRKDVLERYASSMKTLACEYWQENNKGDRKSFCRIEWVRLVVQAYFFEGIMQKELAKENRRLKIDESFIGVISEEVKLRLLDVGSCYNPFKAIPFCHSYGIDLCPADSEVKQCDFLQVATFHSDSHLDEWFTDPVTSIPENSFHIVTFCLFLEYLPSPKQRLKACETAWKVLKPNGILIIITPDSCHASAHSVLMKKWKIALAHIGFVRFRIEKLKFLYCMAFRKSLHIDEYVKLPEYQCEGVPIIAIPQDSVDYIGTETANGPVVRYHNENVENDFVLLPHSEALNE